MRDEGIGGRLEIEELIQALMVLLEGGSEEKPFNEHATDSIVRHLG